MASCMAKWNAMKNLATLLSLFLVCGCSVKPPNSQSQTDVAQTQQVPQPTVEPTPYKFPQLTQSESLTLDRSLPKNVRQILEQSEELELISIKSCIEGFFPDLKRVAPDKFQGCPILKRVVISDASLKRQVLDGLYYGIATAPGSAACFSPQHGIRGVHNGQRIELVICFHCSNYRGVSESGELYGSISKAPEELFNKVLSDSARN